MSFLDKSRGIIIVTLNIMLGMAGGVEAAMQALKEFNVDVGVLQEAKLNNEIHVGQGAG